ncbi:MAG: hypothetical protein JJW01_01770 [Alphaproteobacteria bacterium]|nr:hypothetical protein [Rickettsiales bacterium]
MAKIAKTASKNSPAHRGKVVSSMYNGKPVVKVALHSRNDGRKNVSSAVAFKESAASMATNLLIKKSDGGYLFWNELSDSGN